MAVNSRAVEVFVSCVPPAASDSAPDTDPKVQHLVEVVETVVMQRRVPTNTENRGGLLPVCFLR